MSSGPHDFQGVNAAYIEELYERFLRDPHSVDASARALRHEDLHAPEVRAVDAQPGRDELVERVDAGLEGLHLLGQLDLQLMAS